jgi:hypothetical protein
MTALSWMLYFGSSKALMNYTGPHGELACELAKMAIEAVLGPAKCVLAVAI